MNIMQATRLQCAADDVATLADMVGDLARLLDRIAEDHGSAISDRVAAAFPLGYQLGPRSNAELLKLARALAPPEVIAMTPPADLRSDERKEIDDAINRAYERGRRARHAELEAALQECIEMLSLQYADAYAVVERSRAILAKGNQP